MAGMTATLRLEKKDSIIADLRGKLKAKALENKELRALARGRGTRTTARATDTAASTGKSRRPASSKGRASARARSTGRRRSVAPAASATA